MGLFTKVNTVGEQSPPTSIFESMCEINRICNDIALSQPALEALVELPELASQFDVVNTAPSVAMLEFVTNQKYETLGMESFSVATEGILSSVGSGIKKAYDWIMKKLTQLGEWIKSFFSKKPVDGLKKAVDEDTTKVQSQSEFILTAEDRHGRLVLLKELRQLLNTADKAEKQVLTISGLIKSLKIHTHPDHVDVGDDVGKEREFYVRAGDVIGCLWDYSKLFTNILRYINLIRSKLVSRKNKADLHVCGVCLEKLKTSIEIYTGQLGAQAKSLAEASLKIKVNDYGNLGEEIRLFSKVFSSVQDPMIEVRDLSHDI